MRGRPKKAFKPAPIYVLASGMYPILPAMDGGRGNKFSITTRISKDYRGRKANEPAMWYQGLDKDKRSPYIQGNRIFETRHSKPAWFKQQEDIERLDLTGMKQSMRGIPRSMNQQLAKSMNVKLGGNYRKIRTPNKVPSAMGETYQEQNKENINQAKAIDALMEKQGLNITASSLAAKGHGFYGSGRRRLATQIQAVDGELDAGILTQRQANQKKVQLAANYFNRRIPQWNLQINQIKRSQGLDAATRRKLASGTRLTPTQFKSFQRHFASHPDIENAGITGMLRLNEDMGSSSAGHFYSGSKQMTAQLLGNPDLFFTRGKGVWESWPIDDYTFGLVGPFHSYASGAKQFNYKTPVRGYYVHGYDATQASQGIRRNVSGVYASDIQNRMTGFLNATHQNTDTNVRINSLTNVYTVSELTKAGRLRPDVNLVGAGNALNRAIDNLIGDLQKAGRNTVPPILRGILMKNRFKLRMKSRAKNETSIWAVPYVSFFDVKSLGAGYSTPKVTDR
jgi:hypothetical protein